MALPSLESFETRANKAKLIRFPRPARRQASATPSTGNGRPEPRPTAAGAFALADGTARLGEVSWKNLKLTDPEFARLIAAAGRLGETQVVFDPGPWKSLEVLYARATWTVREFGLARIAFWEWALSTGLPLSIAPQPWGWFGENHFQEHQLLILAPWDMNAG